MSLVRQGDVVQHVTFEADCTAVEFVYFLLNYIRRESAAALTAGVEVATAVVAFAASVLVTNYATVPAESSRRACAGSAVASPAGGEGGV